ncbi:MAG: tyrosine--tRNA ligase [Gammaproteobacteria bacterium]|nr:tyrosine--tRNA ligase [Gammaproteobacteria bacterium]
MSGTVLEEFGWRGLVAQISDREGLSAHLGEGSRTVYCGFDPTADSLHIGSLVPLLALQRLQKMGHRPIILVGGATGLIGDPSFRADERSLNTKEIVGEWVQKIRKQVEPYVSFEGNNAALLVNNLDWTQSLDVITFLREIGKHFSVNAMIARDSVRTRLDREGQGISFTEFSYMLLQGMDFLELARRHNCTLQIGGSDQWGNIVSGIDLIRRVMQRQSFGLTLPLVTRADGGKFGKTAVGTVWLDPVRTSPYTFYQFWFNASDADVINYLKYFTFLSAEEIGALSRASLESPHRRTAQHRLAELVTRLVHGLDGLRRATRISESLFAGELQRLTVEDLEQLSADGLPAARYAEKKGALTALVDTGLAKSTGEARKLVESGAVTVNGQNLVDSRFELSRVESLFGRFHLLRKGKRNWAIVELTTDSN